MFDPFETYERDAGKPPASQPHAPVYEVIRGIPDGQAAQSWWRLRKNIKRSMKSGLPKLHNQPDYGKYKGPEPLAIVAGGPSLNKTMDELRTMTRIMVCGSAHDHLIKNGIEPTYATVCDADPAVAEFYKTPSPNCIYLVASRCDRTVFEALKGFNVVMWHSEDSPSRYYKKDPRIQGGCTITLRSINIAIVLGYLNLHFFGFDSSWPFASHRHAYDAPFDKRDYIEAKVYGPRGENDPATRKFLTNREWFVQALHFQEMMRHQGYMINTTIHGDGMIAAMMKIGGLYADKMKSWSAPIHEGV